MNTKSIEVVVTFKSGETLNLLTEVNKSSYTSLQSKASTMKNTLIAKIATGAMTVAEAREKWNTRVVKAWHAHVDSPVMSSFPEAFADHIKSIDPATDFLKLDLGDDEEEIEVVDEEPEAEGIELEDEECELV